MEETEVFYPASIAEWQDWLEINHSSKQSVWVVFYKKASGKPSVTWSDAVNVALCFGWIDSKKIAVDKEKSHQFFSKRKVKSTWSKINKEKVTKLIEAGLMTSAGYTSIEIARQNGSWTLLNDVDDLIIPADLGEAFKLHHGSQENFYTFSKSSRKAILQWLILAKLPQTRLKRINEIAELAGHKLKPKQFR